MNSVSDERVFELYYFSEVQIVVEVFTVEDAGEEWVVATATHPMENVGLSDWYHFSDETDSREGYSIQVCVGDSVRESTLYALDDVTGKLWPGPKFFYERNDEFPDDEDEMYEHFRQDFLHAFLTGGIYPNLPGYSSIPRDAWIEEFHSENFPKRKV